MEVSAYIIPPSLNDHFKHPCKFIYFQYPLLYKNAF